MAADGGALFADSHDTDLPVSPYLVGSSSWYGCLVYIYTHILWCDGDHHRAFSFSLWIGRWGSSAVDTAEQSDGGSKQGLHIMALKVEGR